MKSASTIICDYQIEMMKFTAKRNGQSVLEKFSSGRGRAYRGKLDFKTFLILLYVNFVHGDIVLKSHAGPTFFAKLLVNLGLAKVSYSYRDPRDAVLSIIDHGARTRKELIEKGESLEGTRGFRHIHNVEDALPEIKKELPKVCAWKKFDGVQLIQYEDFIGNKRDYLTKIAEYLGYNLSKQDLDTIYQKYETSKPQNFNKGTKDRYQTEMKPEEIKLCNQAFYDELKEIEYSVSEIISK